MMSLPTKLSQKLYNRKISNWIFILIFAGLFFAYGFNDISFMRPQGVHQWRQCDCLAFTQSYYQYGNNFMQPKLLFLAQDGTGKAASDFPLIYYSVAQLWKIFGKHEFIYRTIVMVLAFFGLFSLFKIAEDVLKDSFIALWISFILYSSTIFAYYANNFLMNVPAFSLALIALYFFYLFYKKRKNKYLYTSLFIYTISGLLKVPSLTSFAAIVGILFLESFSIIKFKQRIFFDLKRQIPPFLLVFIIVASWYSYASLYNSKYNSGLFLIGILPIWGSDIKQFWHIIEYVNILWKTSYQSIPVQLLSGAMFVILLFSRKKNNQFLWWFTLILSFGFLAFIMLWFQVFDHHDYYLINQLIFMMSIFLTFFYFVQKNYKKVYSNIFFRSGLVIILFYNIVQCSQNIHARYYGWPNDNHLKYTKALENITPYLRSLKISEKDKVMFMNDPSLNISLYLMGQKGYTDYGFNHTTEDMDNKIELGVKYLILNDSSLLNENYLKPYLQNKIGQYKNIHIFKVGSDK